MARANIQPAEKPGVDMTPMLDIVFIMLIFFIVTATFIKETGLTVNHPPHGGPPPSSKDNEVIGFRIDANNRVFFEGHQVDFWSADAIIKQGFTENPELPVVIQVSKGSKMKTLIRLYDGALLAGIPVEQVAVTTLEE